MKNHMKRTRKRYFKFDEDYLRIWPHHEQYPYNSCKKCCQRDRDYFEGRHKEWPVDNPEKIVVWSQGVPMYRVVCPWHAIKCHEMPDKLMSWTDAHKYQQKKMAQAWKDWHIYWKQQGN